MLKQREAVFNAVIAVFKEHGVSFEEGQNATPLLEQDGMRAQVHNIVTEGFANGEVFFSPEAQAKYNTPEKLRGYTSGLISNWLRKDLRLNGNVKYVPKNPGSRTGSQDPELKNLRLLAKTITDESKLTMINERIETRLSEIQTEKAKKVEVDFSHIDPDLIDELGIEV